MEKLRKKVYAFLLLINLVLMTLAEPLAAFGGGTPPPASDDPNVVTSVTYDTSVTTPTTKYYVGQQVPFYANTQISSLTASYAGPYTLIYLDKTIFDWPSVSDISDYINMPAGGGKSIDATNADYYIIKLKYINLGGGTTTTVPFKVRLKANGLANGETYTIPMQLYKSDGTLIESSNHNFVAYTYPIGDTNGVNWDSYYYYLQGSSDLQSNTLMSNNTASYIRVDGQRVEWPVGGATVGTSTKNIGFDRRKTRITVQLPGNTIWDPSLSGNNSWTYNPATQTITKDVLINNYYDYSGFTMKYNNQPVGTSSATAVAVNFPITWQFVNDDGSLDPASLLKSTSTARYYSYPGTPPNDYGLYLYKQNTTGEILKLNNKDDSKHGYITYAYWSYSYGNPNQPPAYGTHKTVTKFIDTPVEELELESAYVYYSNSNSNMLDAGGNTVQLPTFDAAQIASMGHNKLVGTLPGGSTEVIATDIPVNNNYYQDASNPMFTLPAPKRYTKIELIFDTAVQLQSPNGSLGLKLNFRLTDNSFNTVKTAVNATGTAHTQNKGKVETTTGTAPAEVTGAQYYSKPYASEWNYYSETGSISPSLSYYNQNIAYHHSTYFTGKLGEPWQLENAKYVVIAPPELEYKGSTMYNYSWGTYPTGIPASGTISTTYQTIYNYKGTGMTAYVHDLSDLYLPIANASNNIYSADFTSSFRATRNMSGGNYTVRSVLYYDNNGAPSEHPVPGASADPLDVDNDGNTAERFIYRSATAQYSPPLELILTKRSKRADSSVYSSVTTADGNQEVDYQLNIYNNSIQNVGGFTFLDILPYAGDKAIAPNDDGSYDDRGSTFGVTMTGPLDANAHYTYQYSTDTPVNGNIAANYAANWVNSVADWSQVKMIKITMNPGYLLTSGQTDTLHFKVRMPESSSLNLSDRANNSFAGFSGGNTSGAFEALSNTIVPAKYTIKGKVYYDVAPANGIYNTGDGDVVAGNRTVKLYDAGNHEIASTTTDTDGDYSFDNISARGNYTIRITPSGGDSLSTVAVPSTSTVIGNDFSNETFGGGNVFKYTVTLTPEANNRTANAALYAADSTLRVKYQDDAGAPLIDGSGNNVADSVTTHGFMAVYNVSVPADPSGTGNYEYVELHASSKPLAGTLAPGENVVILVYKRKDAGDVTVHHYEEGTTNSLEPDENMPGAGRLGLPYNTNPKTIANFSVVTPLPSNQNGTYTTGSQTVTYEYRRNDAGDVIINHTEQGTGAILSPQETLSGTGKLGLPYTTSEKNIANYVLTAQPANKNGTFAAGIQTVNYVYRRADAGNVVVHHYEQGTTNTLMPDFTISGAGKLGLPYNTTEHTIPNYTLVAQPANKNGVFTAGTQTVTYEYRRNDAGNIIVHHYEAGGTNSVAPDEFLSGANKAGLAYTTTPATVPNFTVVNAAPAGNTGTYPGSGTVTVVYEYTRNDAGNVIVHHYEAGTTTSLRPDITLPGAGKLGLPYTTNEESISDYELVAQPANKNGTFAAGTQIVTYEYRRKDAGDVVVYYVDVDGNEIDTSETLSGVNKLGLPYNTSARSIQYYSLVNAPANANGVFVSGTQTVTYVYRRDDAGNVTVEHKSKYDNSDLTTPVILDGTMKLGLPYTTNAESYSDFEIDTVPANASGVFVSGAQTVTYLYKRKNAGVVTVNYLDNNGNSIETTDTITGTENVGLPYTTSPKSIQYYDLIVTPANANGVFTVAPITVDYIYKRQDAGNVTIEHIDEDGNVLLEAPEVLDGTEKMGMPYTSQVKSFENYDVVSIPANASGVFASGAQTVTYVYRRKDAGNVIVHYLDTARQPLEPDDNLDGTRKLGLPYSVVPKAIDGYHVIRVLGITDGIFESGAKEITYIYMKDPSPIITPTPLPVPAPSPIITPGSVPPAVNRATPSQIIDPHDMNNDIIIRPNRATPSNINRATSSNSGGGSGGSSDKSGRSVHGRSASTENALETQVEKLDMKPEEKKPLPVPVSERKPLPVPKTSDSMELARYIFMLISSLTAAVVFMKKKKTDK